MPAIQACPDLELKAIYSRSLKSAQALAAGLDGVEVYSDDSEKSCDDLLARADVQAVIIALPIPVLPDYVKKALSAGKHALSEKPIAKDVATAVELIEWYERNIDTTKVTFGIAENFRYTKIFQVAAERVKDLGEVQSFGVRIHIAVKQDSSYYNTAWRQKPEYQGGYILDVGVHFIAALRLMLGPQKLKKVCAFSSLQTDYLPPIDSVEATLQLENAKAAGTVSMSVGNSFHHVDCAVACSKGSVLAEMLTGKVKTKPVDGKETEEIGADGQSNVKHEILAWGKSLVGGALEKALSPKEALADLELIEAMLKSAEAGGQPLELKYQV